MSEPTLITCARRNMNLTAHGCARLWLSANGRVRPEPHEGRAACVGCPQGAAIAGRPNGQRAAVVERWRRVCSRCQIQSPRMIGGDLCPSCYNRQREVQVGANGRGTRPGLRLSRQSLCVADGQSGWRLVAGLGTGSPIELMVRSVRTARDRMLFSRPLPALPVEGFSLSAPAVPAAPASTVWSTVCPRCCAAGRRLIASDLCVSCYNRQREVRVGANRKGTAPRLRVGQAAIVVRRPDAATVERGEVVGSVAEMLIRIVRRGAAERMVFSSAAPSYARRA